MKILGLIPARYASTRLPGKALEEIEGKSMIQRVYEQALKCEDLNEVFIATDHDEICDHVKSFGGNVVMTRQDHKSGTDRCAEAALKLDMHFDYIVNIQGDEPFIDPTMISLLASALDGQTRMRGYLFGSVDDVVPLGSAT